MSELGILDHLDGFTAHSLGLDFDSLFEDASAALLDVGDHDTSDTDVLFHMNAQFGGFRREMRALSGVLKRSFLQQAKNSHAAADLIKKALSQAGLSPSMQELKEIVKVRGVQPAAHHCDACTSPGTGRGAMHARRDVPCPPCTPTRRT